VDDPDNVVYEVVNEGVGRDCDWWVVDTSGDLLITDQIGLDDLVGKGYHTVCCMRRKGCCCRSRSAGCPGWDTVPAQDAET
jgi:hypothetical protein